GFADGNGRRAAISLATTAMIWMGRGLPTATDVAPAAARRAGRLDAVARLGGRAALLLLALALAARALYFFQAALALIRWPFEVIVGEGTMLHESRLLNDGVLGGLRALYGPQAPGRFLAGNYPPLYQLLWALKPGPPAFPTGRALALLAGVVVAVAGGGAVYAAARGSRALRGGTALLGAAAVM